MLGRSCRTMLLAAALAARALSGCMGYVETSVDPPDTKTTLDGSVAAKVDFGVERFKIGALGELGALRIFADASREEHEDAHRVQFAEVEIILARSCAGCHQTGGATPDLSEKG